MTADVGPDGAADWTVAYRIRPDDDNATQAFEDLRADIRRPCSVHGPLREPDATHCRGRGERDRPRAARANGERARASAGVRRRHSAQ